MANKESEPLKGDFEGFSTTRIGKIGETAVIHDLATNYPEFDIYIPLVDDKGCDILVNTGSNFKRVQIKTITRSRYATSVELKVKKHIIMKHRIDVMAVWFGPIRKIAYIPWKGQERVQLAYRRAKNGQEKERDWFYNYMEFPVF
tara:strand:- start:113 stop:547 length:435 start_codon:yes stop_codon:yes gene_type:complete